MNAAVMNVEALVEQRRQPVEVLDPRLPGVGRCQVGVDLHGEVRRHVHVALVGERRDPLRDEGIAYAQRLMGAGVRVELYNAPGAFHGFLSAAPDAAVSRRVMSLITGVLGRVG